LGLQIVAKPWDEDGETVEGFLALYPSISLEQVMTVLDAANRQLIECASTLARV